MRRPSNKFNQPEALGLQRQSFVLILRSHHHIKVSALISKVRTFAIQFSRFSQRSRERGAYFHQREGNRLRKYFWGEGRSVLLFFPPPRHIFMCLLHFFSARSSPPDDVIVKTFALCTRSLRSDSARKCNKSHSRRGVSEIYARSPPLNTCESFFVRRLAALAGVSITHHSQSFLLHSK